MAAARRTAPGQDSDSSSAGEDLERFREAAWEPPGSVKNSVQFSVNSPSTVVPSLRVQPDGCEHYMNELQTTPEFRSHVAKKLSAILDSCIKEIPGNNRFHQESTAASDSEDEGFRLLTTSVPGDSGKIIPSQNLKRKVASSTSDDSEEEKQRRCREAAVSGLDILRHSALQKTPVEIVDTNSNNQRKKKKKKAKMERRQNDETDDQNMELEGKMTGLKKKKKKDRGISNGTQSYDQNIESEAKKNGFKKEKKRERVITAEAQFQDQTICPEPEEQSKKKQTGSGNHNRSETVKDLSKKENKEIGLSKTAPDQIMNSICGKSGTKKKKKKKNCPEHK